MGNFREKAVRKGKSSRDSHNKGSPFHKGCERCGKSRPSYIISKRFKEKESLIINFDDPRLRNIKANEIIKIVELYQENVNENLPRLLVLDEVHNIKGWEMLQGFMQRQRASML